MIAFACPKCSTTLQRADAEAGTTTYCPSCNQKIIVPPAPPQPAGNPFSFTSGASQSAPVGRVSRHRSQGISLGGLIGAAAVIIVALFVLVVGIVVVATILSRPASPPSAKDIAALNSSQAMKGRLQAAFAIDSTYTRDELLEGICKDAATQGDSDAVKVAVTHISSSYPSW
jgi:DNA-directed RNA polymerase subunit RPC12/RpoP